MTETELQDAYQRWLAAQWTSGPTKIDRAAALSDDALLVLAEGSGDADTRLRDIERAVLDPATARAFALLVAARSAAEAAVELPLASEFGLAGEHAESPDAVVAAEHAESPVEAVPLRRPGAARARSWRLPALLAAAGLLVTVGVVAQRGDFDGGPERMRGAANGVSVVGQRGEVMTWRAYPAATRYVVEVLDVNGAVLHEGSTADTTYAVPLELLRQTDAVWMVRALTESDDIGVPSSPRALRPE